MKSRAGEWLPSLLFSRFGPQISCVTFADEPVLFFFQKGVIIIRDPATNSHSDLSAATNRGSYGKYSQSYG